MGTSDTDLRTPDGKHTPCVSNHPLLHKKKQKNEKKTTERSACARFCPHFCPTGAPGARPALLNAGSPGTVGSPHAWLAPEALCKRAARSLGGREEAGRKEELPGCSLL